MDKSLRSYLTFSALVVLLFAALAAVFVYVYRFSTLDTYNSILLIFILLTILFIVLVTLVMLAVLHAYRTRHVKGVLRLPVKFGLRYVMPLVIFASGVFKGSKDGMRAFFVDMNNILVQSEPRKYKPEQVMVLLPHCLQNANCGYKVTNSIAHCKQCGKCCIGNVLQVVRELGVNAVVVTGGTAARNLVSREKPKVIVSVACERDLAVGIADVSGIPVIGVINDRPNGPCFNTSVNPDILRRKLEEILIRDMNGEEFRTWQ